MAKANHTITGNNSLTTINNLALAIETLADVIPPEQSETLPTFVKVVIKSSKTAFRTGASKII